MYCNQEQTLRDSWNVIYCRSNWWDVILNYLYFRYCNPRSIFLHNNEKTYEFLEDQRSSVIPTALYQIFYYIFTEKMGFWTVEVSQYTFGLFLLVCLLNWTVFIYSCFTDRFRFLWKLNKVWQSKYCPAQKPSIFYCIFCESRHTLWLCVQWRC